MKKALSLVLAMLMVLSTMSCLTVMSFAGDVDDNGTQDTATEIVPGETVVGEIYDRSDVDWYKFTADKDYFTVDFAPKDKTIESAEWDVIIYDSKMVKLSDNNSKNRFVTTELAYSGDFYICVARDDYCDNVEYAFEINTVEDPLYENEYNDKITDADLIETDKIYTGQINALNDVADWYKFEATKDYFTVEFASKDKTIKSAEWDVIIYDAQMNELSNNNSKNNFLTTELTYTGEMYVYVRYDDYCHNVAYEIKVNTFENDFRESEYNNEIADANLIETDKIYTGEINSLNDNADWYKFETTKDYFTVDFGPEDIAIKNVEWDVIIYDAQMNELSYYNSINSLSTIRWAYTGTIYVCVKDDDYSHNVDYRIKVNTFENGNWEKENNNDTTAANVINQGSVYKGTIINVNDTDCYKFKATSNAFKVKFDIDLNDFDPAKVGNGWKVYVYSVDSANEIAVYNADAKKLSFETRTIPCTKNKEYFIKVCAQGSWAPVDCIYNITAIDASQGKNWETEKMVDDYLNATTIKSGVNYNGNLYSNADNDVYKINIPAAGKLTIKFARTIGNGESKDGWAIHLYHASTKTLIDTYNFGNNDEGTYTFKTAAKGGNYYVVVVPATRNAPDPSIDYNFTVTYNMSVPTVKSAGNVSNGIQVKWAAVNDCAGYYVYRKAGSGKFTKIATIKNGTTTSYTDNTAKAGIKYTYTVSAFDAKITSAYNKTGKACVFIKAPKLTSLSSAKNGITVKWQKADKAQGYYVYRKAGNGAYKKLAVVKGNAKVSYLDKSAKKGVTYTYKLEAFYSSYNSVASNAKMILDRY